MSFKQHLLTWGVALAVSSLSMACAPSVESLYQKADAHFVKGEYAQAFPLYEQILRRDPNQATALMKLALTSLHTEQWDSCLRYSQMALDKKSDFFEVYFARAMCFENSQKNAEAIKAYRETLQRFPDQTETYKHLARVYFQSGQDRQAAETYQKLSQLDPKDRDNLFNLATSYDRLRDYPQAEKYFQELLKLEPHSPNGHFGLGSVYEHMGKPDLALKHYREALFRNPEHLSALYNTARLQQKTSQDRAKAKAAWQAYLKVAESKTGQAKFIERAKESLKKLGGK